jgi:hypothetical protein
MRKVGDAEGPPVRRWLHGTAAPRGGMRYAHSAGPFNKHAELERVWTSARARARAADGCSLPCKKWDLSHTNIDWYMRPIERRPRQSDELPGLRSQAPERSRSGSSAVQIRVIRAPVAQWAPRH